MKAMKNTGAALSVGLLLLGARGHADDLERQAHAGNTVAALRTWVEAVQIHVPGTSDQPVVILAALSYEAREELNAGMNLFLETMLTRRTNPYASADARHVMAFARTLDIPDGRSFLKRAAVLHADVAAYGDRLPVAQRLSPASGLGEPVPPLLRSDRLIVGQDGQATGETLASWNWPFARSLLVLLERRGADKATDPFVGAWYHATMAYMFANGLYGDAASHLRDAARWLPDDARILFDRGCYAELLGLPMHQALLSDRDIVEQRAGDRQSETGVHWRVPDSRPSLNIPREEATNAEAERLYRQALAIEPSRIEARVRLARLLDLRKRHNDAAVELTTALAGRPVGVVGFYARLFAGRTAQARGRTNEARGHYDAAREMYPDAQSALLASSQLALLEADVPSALAPLGGLGGRSEVFTADPWWQYFLCAGRDADELLKAVWAAVPR